jgi:hypothetical protein
MKRKSALVCALAVFTLALVPVNAKAAGNGKTLKVKLNYTGTEKVDQNHRIYVLLFDANPYTSRSLIDSTSETAPPAPEAGVCHILRREAASGRNQVVTFKGLGTSPVFAMAFLDKIGNYDPRGEPPSGSPMGMYGKSLDQPEQIKLEAGKAVKVVLPFGDSHKVP